MSHHESVGLEADQDGAIDDPAKHPQAVEQDTATVSSDETARYIRDSAKDIAQLGEQFEEHTNTEAPPGANLQSLSASASSSNAA